MSRRCNCRNESKNKTRTLNITIFPFYSLPNNNSKIFLYDTYYRKIKQNSLVHYSFLIKETKNQIPTINELVDKSYE